MNKLAHLGLSIVELSKILMYQFWYDYIKSKYSDSFIVYIKTDGIYKKIAEDGENRFDTSNYELDRPLPKGRK